MRPTSYRVPRQRRPWQYSLISLFVLTTICAVLLKTGKAFPLETLIVLGIVAGAVLAVGLYVGELVVIGWIVDLPVWLAERAMPAAHVPLEFEQIGEITIVTLGDNIASARECRSVQEQLDRLIAEHRSDLILDFSRVKKLSSRFRDVLLHVARTAGTEAVKEGRSQAGLELAPGEAFRRFDNRDRAVSEMSKYAGHGWIALCAVPVGIRAVPDTA